ncbi:glycosyltransferase family 4 protein [Patescibacteria group bacterium]
MATKIGIDCQKILTPNGSGAGIEHYVYHIVSALAEEPSRSVELILFFNSQLKGSSEITRLGRCSGVNIEFFPEEAIERSSWWPYSKYKKMSSYLNQYDLDLLHGPANITPLFYSGKTVVTVHDLIIYEHPEWFPGGMSDWFWRKQVVPRSITRASRMIAVSRFTKQQICDWFKIVPDKVDVVYEGITMPARLENSNILKKLRITAPYLLYVGTIEPRKNLARIIEAFGKVSRKQPQLQLVIAGKKGWKYEKVFTAVKRLSLEDKIIFTGYIDNADKATLYNRALAFVFPSLAEGFGLPVLDAMQADVPVVTSNTTSLKEVAGDAAIKVDPSSVKSITAGLEKVTGDESLRESLVVKGRRQAAKFSWRRAAKETLQTYKRALDAN